MSMGPGVWMVKFSWLVIVLLHTFVIYSECNCEDKGDCIGHKTECVNKVCTCPGGYTLHSNGRDCQQNDTCDIFDCLECESESLCTKCVHYLDEGRTQCLQECHSHTTFDENERGPICMPGSKDDDGLSTDVVIGIIAGVSAALLLCIIGLVILCIYYRRTRRNVNLNQTRYAVGNMQAGNVKKVPMYDNKGFDRDNEPSLVHNLIDRDVYLNELDRLKPHAQTLLTMLNEIRHKLRAMDKSDPRVSTYKGVIHQLCRVLVLIHKTDPGASIPSDALGLMEWAHQMIEDKQLDVEPAEDSLETNPVNKISYIEVPPSIHKNNPYATPVIKKPNPYATLNKRNSQLNMSNVSNLSNTSYYSSVPVPVDLDNTPVNHVSVSQNNTMKSTTKERLKRQYEIPWDLKKVSDSFSTLNCSGSDLTMGYFSNGRYYDPTPRQQSMNKGKQQQPDIYAPASSYSDRSNPPIFSTFTGGVPRNQSFSSQTSTASNISEAADRVVEEEEEEEEDDRGNDGDGFPFNLNDATEPVEV